MLVHRYLYLGMAGDASFRLRTRFAVEHWVYKQLLIDLANCDWLLPSGNEIQGCVAELLKDDADRLPAEHRLRCVLLSLPGLSETLADEPGRPANQIEVDHQITGREYGERQL